jgi:hypothetical protein
VVVVSAAALALGCSGGAVGGGDGGDGGSSVPFDRFGSAFAAAYCHQMFMCCNADELTSIDATAVDEASCQSGMTAFFSGKLAVTQAEIDAGLVVYHGDRARACLDKLAALSCRQWVADDRMIRFAECRDIVEGTLATGSGCATSGECSSGHCGTSTGARICTPRSQLGESCDFAECVAGLACRIDESGDALVCGQALADGTRCIDSRDCVSSFCIADGAGLAFCGLPPFCDGI